MYKTKDLSLASLCLAADCKLLEYEIDDQDQFWFYFEDSETVSTLAKNFYLSAAVANVQRFTAAQKMLKSLIYKNKKVKDDYPKYTGRRTAEHAF